MTYPTSISPELDASFIQTYRILPYGPNQADWNPYVVDILNSHTVNPASYQNVLNDGVYPYFVNSTAIMTYNNMTHTGVTVSIENAYTVFYGPIDSSSNTISTDVSGISCFVDPCVSSSGNIVTDCYLADGIREFIATINVSPVVSFFPCENGLNITISPIFGNASGNCPINDDLDPESTYTPLTFPIGFNEGTYAEATLISLLTITPVEGILTYVNVQAMYAPISFELLDVNENPTTYTNACSLKVSPQDTCFQVYFGITRCCQGYNFILISSTIALQFFFWMNINSIYILTIAESSSGLLSA
jgi:hypothetical protein